ncbi:MAG TPA: ATP-dependent helicase HrpB [Vicinamibacterales bacterium]|nr:ATP-dependent helicase HrpB [Vicinamibacterales bacterium]
MPLSPLPVDPFLPRIVDHVRRARAVVVTAAPGAGKTTRVPPALVGDGAVVLLQPRRMAVRSIAARIAAERGWTLGREVGWQVRFERRSSPETRLLVVTEGILTARLQSDPLLSGFATIVLDEFHERSIHADVAIALARQAWRARDDLRLVVMSATLDAGAVSSFLDDCPIVQVPGRLHPLQVSYAPGQTVADAAVEVIGAASGHVLCFLPGAGEIRRAVQEIERQAGADVEVVPLHGSLSSDEQDRALQPTARRRVIVATNIAETSLTVPGVTAVVDSGLHKFARYDVDRGIDRLDLERITADAAEQRAGRAGREAPGLVRRLWDARDRLRPHREPDIRRIDLSAAALDVIAWGGDPRTLEWFEAPAAEKLAAAIELLERLGLAAGGALTPLGEQIRAVPLHPRLARMLAAGGGSVEVARACALLTEHHALPPRAVTTASDLLSALDQWSSVPPHVQRVAGHISDWGLRIAGVRNPPSAMGSEADFRRALLTGYPDRVAQRRAPGTPDFLLASGTGATQSRESGVRDAELIVALDVQSALSRGAAGAPLIRIASGVDREWLQPTSAEVVHRFDPETGRVRAVEVVRYDAIVLRERAVQADPETAARLLADAWRDRGPRGDDERLIRRLAFAGRLVDSGDTVELHEHIRTAALGARSLDDISLADALPHALVRDLARDAPDALTVPSGRSVLIDYRADGTPTVSVKLQELFGLVETPRIGRRQVPVRLELLAPSGRPVQVTQDLRSFWERTYPVVRKELRGRYPKHPWPEDPWSAKPTARTKRKPHS